MGEAAVTLEILDLSLEIMSLLTGETFTAVTSGDLVAIMAPPHRCEISNTTSSLKILQVTNKMLELLTGEVPIRCQDVAVYLSMEERKFLEEHRELYTAAMMEDHKSFSSVTKDKAFSMMEAVGSFMVEIIQLLTGEDLTAPMKSCAQSEIHNGGTRKSTRLRTNQRPIPLPSPLSIISQENLQKVLEVANKMVQLLTGEVPIRCQDVAVYLSMEERKYLEEHEELYTAAMMEGQLPRTPADGQAEKRTSRRSVPRWSGDDTDDSDFPQPEDSCTTSDSEDRHTSAKSQKSIKCPDCNKCFGQKALLVIHQRVHTGNRPYCCLQCGKRFKQHPHLRRHQRQHTGERPHRCPECGKCFAQKDILQEHLCLHTGNWRFHCSVCGKGFIRKSRLDSHFVCHQAVRKEVTPVSCPDCGKTYKHKSSLGKHKRSHTDKLPFVCPECGKGYRRKDHMTKHMLTHTDERPYSCAKCGKRFKLKFCLTQHLHLHSRENSFSCSDCGRTFSKKSRFLAHQAAHDRNAVFCPECGKPCKSQAELQAHLKGHFPGQKVSCPDCGKDFLRNSDLIKHLKVHTGQKPYSCPHCARTFSQKTSRDRHLKLHAGD